jgi:hypothetical protein
MRRKLESCSKRTSSRDTQWRKALVPNTVMLLGITILRKLDLLKSRGGMTAMSPSSPSKRMVDSLVWLNASPPIVWTCGGMEMDRRPDLANAAWRIPRIREPGSMITTWR